jgi:cytochrome P450
MTETKYSHLPSDFIQCPHAYYAQARQQAAACPVETADGLRVWFVTRYAEARAALGDPRLRKDGPTLNDVMRDRAVTDDPPVFPSALGTHMLTKDPPDHTRLRGLVNKAFIPRRIDALRARTEQVAKELLDAMEAHDEVDLITAFSHPLPMTVISELLGLQPEARTEFVQLVLKLVKFEADERGRPKDLAAMGQAVGNLVAFFQSLITQKREQPADDMLSAMVQARDEGDRLDDTELVSTVFLLLLAGQDTTVQLINNGVVALLENPEQLALLQRDPSLIPRAVDEFLRFDGSLNTALPRFSAEDVQVGDVTIPKGEIVMVSLLSANRDPEHYANPDQLDVSRGGDGHLAFGYGPHFCLGAHLARMEGIVAFTQLLQRFPDLKLAVAPSELKRRKDMLIHAFETLPVRLRG